MVLCYGHVLPQANQTGFNPICFAAGQVSEPAQLDGERSIQAAPSFPLKSKSGAHNPHDLRSQGRKRYPLYELSPFNFDLSPFSYKVPERSEWDQL
jgi:hypothetical protein